MRWSNLLSNALRYTPEAGDITIRITSTAQTTTVAVENTGTDIDAKILPRLFDRFYRADASRAHPDSDGSGLGLAITLMPSLRPTAVASRRRRATGEPAS